MEKLERVVNALVEQGKAKGYLTYDEMNKLLPDDEFVSPEQIDDLLRTLDELNIGLVDHEKPVTTGGDGARADEDERL